MAKRKNFPGRQQQRRDDAAARQAAYDALPQADKDARNPKKAKVQA
jgi:hypothetical protein